jgi:hypothetical protein
MAVSGARTVGGRDGGQPVTGSARGGARAAALRAPLRQLPDGITDLDQFRVQRRDRAGSVIHEYRLVA